MSQNAAAICRAHAMDERFTSIVDAHVVLRRHGKILLLRRAGNVYASGQLCLPSGPSKTARTSSKRVRETREETGITPRPSRHVPRAVHPPAHSGTTHTRFGGLSHATAAAERAADHAADIRERFGHGRFRKVTLDFARSLVT